ncbi:hypothetical protein M5E88_13230 [Akkermansia muciniphila]|nr:hypothetical protein M5E88_13230 [Akkermansia muciniphila]
MFNGGVSIRIEDGVRQGFIDKDRLTLCPDVPQFKQGADEKTGVVNRIVGTWQRNAAPISVWRRTDGSLQVISGRHRLDACTDADINCTVYEEGIGSIWTGPGGTTWRTISGTARRARLRLPATFGIPPCPWRRPWSAGLPGREPP